MIEPSERLTTTLADRYRIERELGRGGMATVYLAHDVRHERDVAVKVLSPELAGSLGRQRFVREIRMAAKLNHPHILPLYDSGECDGSPRRGLTPDSSTGIHSSPLPIERRDSLRKRLPSTSEHSRLRVTYRCSAMLSRWHVLDTRPRPGRCWREPRRTGGTIT